MIRDLSFEDSFGIKFTFSGGVLTIDATNLKEGARPWLYAETEQNGQYTDAWEFLQKNTERVIIEGNITEMPYPVFQHFEKLADLRLPDSLEYIRDFDFIGCAELKKLTLPAKTRINGPENNYFHSIEVDKDNPYYSSVNGCLMSKDGKTLIVAPGGLDELIIPEGCEEIGEESIYMSYEKIVIPSSVSSIHECNFIREYGIIVLGDYNKQYKLVEECFSRDYSPKEEYQKRFQRIKFV